MHNQKGIKLFLGISGVYFTLRYILGYGGLVLIMGNLLGAWLFAWTYANKLWAIVGSVLFVINLVMYLLEDYVLLKVLARIYKKGLITAHEQEWIGVRIKYSNGPKDNSVHD